MDKEKLLTKTHGGALYHDNSADNKELTGKAYFFHERALENKKEKEGGEGEKYKKKKIKN